MYNLRSFPFPYEFYYDKELIISVLVFLAIITVIMVAIFKRYNVLSKVAVFLRSNEKLIDSNYTLNFESVDVSNELSVKKISVATKTVLYIFALTFIVLPFSDFLPTLEYSNAFYGCTIYFLP